MSSVPDDIRECHDGLDPESRGICDALLEIIERELPDAERKVWHAHPVWFFDGNTRTNRGLVPLRGLPE